jgi:hypothetical protein
VWKNLDLTKLKARHADDQEPSIVGKWQFEPPAVICDGSKDRRFDLNGCTGDGKTCRIHHRTS